MPKALLTKAIGCPCCWSTAPMPLADASVSTVNGRSKFGRAKTGADVKAALRA